MVLYRRSVSLTCTSSRHTKSPDRWKERHWGNWGGQEGRVVQISLVSNRSEDAIGLLSPLRACLFSVENSPAFHVISQAAAAPTTGAKNACTSIVHEFGVAISAPVSFKGWRLVTLADRRLRVWRLHWSRSALPPRTQSCTQDCIVPTGKARLRRGSPRCRFVCWSDGGMGRCYLGLTARGTV
jgi:hypothetical protein